MEIVMASEEDDNTTIKGTFSELGKKYLFADTATRGKNYYKLEIPESGIYDLYIYDDIDESMRKTLLKLAHRLRLKVVEVHGY